MLAASKQAWRIIAQQERRVFRQDKVQWCTVSTSAVALSDEINARPCRSQSHHIASSEQHEKKKKWVEENLRAEAHIKSSGRSNLPIPHVLHVRRTTNYFNIPFLVYRSHSCALHACLHAPKKVYGVDEDTINNCPKNPACSDQQQLAEVMRKMRSCADIMLIIHVNNESLSDPKKE